MTSQSEIEPFVDSSSEPWRILLVDDEAAVLRLHERALSRGGFEVRTAEDGEAALEALAQAPVDVVLTDITMPRMDGVELLKAIRGSGNHVPVILLTGMASLETAIDAVELGASKYLCKPVPLPELVDTARRIAGYGRVEALRREAADLAAKQSRPDTDLSSLGAVFDDALERLWMAYQPILSATNGTLIAREALMRSDSDQLPHPGALLKAAESLDRLHDLGRCVRARVASDAALYLTRGLIFVNLHPRDLADEVLLSGAEPLAALATRVVLEVTERDSLDSVPDLQGSLKRLRGLGYRIAVDDLGAGYAGLTSIPVLQPAIVKLDMALVRGVQDDPMRQKLIRSMAGVCHELDIHVVAEGVETELEKESLCGLGVDLLQGYLLGRPAPPAPEGGIPLADLAKANRKPTGHGMRVPKVETAAL